MSDGGLIRLYVYPAFRSFLAEVLDKSRLLLMADPMASIYVLQYAAGQDLNWHFDRSGCLSDGIRA